MWFCQCRYLFPMQTVVWLLKWCFHNIGQNWAAIRQITVPQWSALKIKGWSCTFSIQKQLETTFSTLRMYRALVYSNIPSHFLYSHQSILNFCPCVTWKHVLKCYEYLANDLFLDFCPPIFLYGPRTCAKLGLLRHENNTATAELWLLAKENKKWIDLKY